MKCRNCSREIPDFSLYCNWCGKKQLKEKKKEVKVPEPRQLKSGAWNIELRKEGQSVTVSTREECIAKAKAIRAGFVKAEVKKPKLTLGQVIDKYIEANSAVLSPSTIYGYKNCRSNGFKGLMEKDLNHDKIDWQAAVNDEAKKFKPKTVRNRWGVISTSMRAAGLDVPQVNLPQKVKAERPWLDYEQIQSFLGAVKGQDCELAALLALHSLRRSEFLAVTTDDIDLKAGTIRVAGARVFSENGMVTKSTNKNRTSQRTIPIMIPRLTELLQSAEPGEEGRLVTAGPCVSYAHINKVCEQNKLPLVGCHGLRHSFCSLAYHLKWSEMTTMQVGGYANTEVVHDVYTHLAAQDKNEDILKMQQFYEQISEQK